jgi:hypothetical protein
LAYYLITERGQYSLESLREKATEWDGPFGDHLNALSVRLMTDSGPGVRETLRHLVQGSSSSDHESLHRLQGAGIVTRRDGQWALSSELYLSFFRNVLCD